MESQLSEAQVICHRIMRWSFGTLRWIVEF
jgi:hypothetical protein